MPVKYIIRFDDICPTMNWDIWEEIERILVQHQICPILAVVPDNKDKDLIVRKADSGFWEKVRLWQARGWTIGVHGYQHLYVSDQSGLVPINNRSEFAGLSDDEQESKLRKALATFRRERIAPDIWVAPGHSFDATTLAVLKKLGLCLVSDGFYLSPNTDSLGITHIPQQLWRFRAIPFGLWTVCYHHNGWRKRDVERFASDIQRYEKRITSLPRVLTDYQTRNRNCLDRLLSGVYLSVIKIRSSMPRALAWRQQSVDIRPH